LNLGGHFEDNELPNRDRGKVKRRKVLMQEHTGIYYLNMRMFTYKAGSLGIVKPLCMA